MRLVAYGIELLHSKIVVADLECSAAITYIVKYTSVIENQLQIIINIEFVKVKICLAQNATYSIFWKNTEGFSKEFDEN